MRTSRLSKRVVSGLAVLTLVVGLVTVQRPSPVTAGGIPVIDASNLAQSQLIAIRTIRMVQNQIAQLQNEAQMLINMGRNLEQLEFDSLTDLQAAINRINRLMGRSKGIIYQVEAVEAEFQRLFPKDYQDAVTGDQLAADAKQRWTHAMDAFEQTMLVQAQIVENIESDSELLQQLATESQAAGGSLQAQQAGNQLLALNTRQQLQTQQLMAAQFRAEAIDAARRAAAEEQARAQFQHFLGDGQIYTSSR